MTPPVPYPADTRAKGWRFEVDMEAIKSSDTWLLAKTGAVRGALLLLWAEAWQQTPCGTLPKNDELIALLIDMAKPTFQKNRQTLLRGWYEAEDGRLYHETITKRVLAMLDKRASDARRAANRRAKTSDSPETHPKVTRDSPGSPDGSRSEFDTKHQAPDNSEANASGGKPPLITDPEEIIFGYGVSLLTNAGTAEKQARSFLGGLRKHHGDDALIASLRECAKARPLQPLEWLAAALPPKGGKGQSAKPSTHSGFEGRDYSHGVSDDGRII